MNGETPLIMNYRNSGLEVKSYSYYDPKMCGFDAARAYEDLNVSRPTQLYTHHVCLLVCELDCFFDSLEVMSWGRRIPNFL